MMQRLQKLPTPLRVLVYIAAAAAMLAVAVGVGATAALMFASDRGSPEGAEPQQAEEAKPRQGEGAKPQEEAGKQEGASDRQSEAEYLDEVADIQNGSVKTSLNSNDKLLRYDGLTADDIEKLEANHATLEDYGERVEGLDPPEVYEDQYRVFVLAIDELRDANELAYRLAADPASATQANFEAYDRHISRATSHLRRSNEILGRDYKTTEAAQEVSLG
jgi:hypothetical protein